MSTVFERLMDDKGPSLSYEDIAELRNLCKLAKARDGQIAQEDFFIRQTGFLTKTILITADGLECNYRGEVAFGARRIRLPMFRPPARFGQHVEMKVETLPVREYEFEGLRGSVGNRTAVFREVVQ